MSTTTALKITLLEASQAQKEVTVNDAINALDRYAGVLDLTLSGNVTLSATQKQYGTILCTGALGDDAVITVPSDVRHLLQIVDRTTGGKVVSVKLAGGSTELDITGSIVVCKNAAGTELEEIP